MKKLLALLALGALSTLSAGRSYQPYDDNGSYSDNGSYYYDNNDQSGYNRQSNGYQNQNRSSSYSRTDRQYSYQPQYGSNSRYSNDNNQYSNDNDSYDNSYADANQNNMDGNDTADHALLKKVHDKLSSGWFSKGYENVSYTVSNGNVTLRGNVPTIEDRSKVEESVRGIDGVTQVDNQIRISKDATTSDNSKNQSSADKKYPQDYAATDSDRQINSQIRAKLTGGWFSNGIETVVLKTTNGVVFISGTVNSQDDLQKINTEVRKVEGVRGLNNQAQVLASSSTSSSYSSSSY